jgi:hypothetical protein
MDQADEQELATCRRELQRLKAENAALRDSSESFGNLAERLNVALQRERGSSRDGHGPNGPEGP